MTTQLLAAMLLLVSTDTFAAQSLPSFQLLRDTSTVSYAETIAQGDFNGDGRPDIIMGGGMFQSDITLLPGRGDGTFGAPVQVGVLCAGACIAYISDLVAADFNNDGKLDILAVNSADGTFAVLYGNGDGTFQAPVTITTQAYGMTAAVGDFDGDGLLDIAVGDGDGNVEIFHNEGRKNFLLAKVIHLITGNNPGIMRVRAGTVDGSGLIGLGVLGHNAAYVLWGDGKGDFRSVQLASYVAAEDLSVGDLNQDGIADIVVSYTCGPQVQPVTLSNCAGFDVFYGQGNQTTLRRTVVATDGYEAADGIWPVDVNGDGIGDIVALSANVLGGQDGLYVWLGHPDGSFEQMPQQFVVSSARDKSALVAGDWNRDGMVDFAQAMPSLGMTEIYINGGARGPCAVSEINPTVTVCAPVNDTYLTSPVRMQANAYDRTPVTALQEYVDGRLVYSNRASSFDMSLDEAPGVHFLVTKAWDARGVSFRSDRTIMVYTGVPGATCATALGTATLCLPEGTSGSPVHILANGWTENVPTAAQVYVDGRLVVNETGCGSGFCAGGTSYVDTYQAMSQGTHDVVFKLWDSAGKTYVAQRWVAVE